MAFKYSFKVNQFVKVNADRGKTPGMARIISITGQGSSEEAEIVYENGRKDKFYTAHLYQDGETMMAGYDYLKTRAAKIGNVTHPKKK